MYKMIWAGLADDRYYDYIAKYCLPSWKNLPGDKFIIHNTNKINFDFLKIIPQEKTVNLNSHFLSTTEKKKVLSFWKKMQCQVWCIRNLTDCDFLVLLDTDIEVLDNFNVDRLNYELEKFKKSKLPWATGRSNSRLHDSGFIIIRMDHPLIKQMTDDYENIWESETIYTLRKPYDGNAVESMFEKYQSYKIMNIDYGKGFHVYDLGFVHYGSKFPKKLRAQFQGSGTKLVKAHTKDIKIKNYKNPNNS